MKSLISTALVVMVVVTGLVAAPQSTRAQTSPDGATPTPATAPGPAAPPASGQALPADPSALPPADADTAPADPAADDVVVRQEREDREEWQAGQHFRGDGGNNVVMVLNRSDNRMRVRGRIRLVDLHGSRAEPVNAAFAYSSCTDCQTFVVALEIALIAPNASTIAPQNRARALNYECTRCVTVARALQYAYVVDDPDVVPDNVNRLIRDMEKELRDIGREGDISANQANARIDGVVGRFQELAVSLQDQFDETVELTTPGAPSPAAIPGTDPGLVPAPSPSPVP
jgi:hypothetical protein